MIEKKISFNNFYFKYKESFWMALEEVRGIKLITYLKYDFELYHERFHNLSSFLGKFENLNFIYNHSL